MPNTSNFPALSAKAKLIALAEILQYKSTGAARGGLNGLAGAWEQLKQREQAKRQKGFSFAD